MRWPKGPPHLALNPPLFLVFVFCLLFFFFVYFFGVFVFFVSVFFGGFKGQVRWPKGPPHLALNPPYFLFFFLCLFFIAFNRKPQFFPIKKAIFVYLSVFPFVSL